MKKLYLIGLILLSGISLAIGQSPTADEWTLLEEENGVRIYYQMNPSCAQKNSFFLKFENTSTEVKTVNWTVPSWVSKPVLQTEALSDNSAEIQPGTELSGACSSLAPINLFWVSTQEGSLPSATDFNVTSK